VGCNSDGRHHRHLGRAQGPQPHRTLEVFSNRLTGELLLLAGLASLVILINNNNFTSIVDGFLRG
jgi:hypothetical protein